MSSMTLGQLLKRSIENQRSQQQSENERRMQEAHERMCQQLAESAAEFFKRAQAQVATAIRTGKGAAFAYLELPSAEKYDEEDAKLVPLAGMLNPLDGESQLLAVLRKYDGLHQEWLAFSAWAQSQDLKPFWRLRSEENMQQYWSVNVRPLNLPEMH